MLSSSDAWPWLGRHFSGSSSEVEVSCVELFSRFDLVKLRVRLRNKLPLELPESPLEFARRDFERKVAVRCNKFLKLLPEVLVRCSMPFLEMPLEMLRRIDCDAASFFAFFSWIKALILSFSSTSSAVPAEDLCTLWVDLSPFLKAFFSSCGSSASLVSLLRISAISSDDTSVGLGFGSSGSGLEPAHPIAESPSLSLLGVGWGQFSTHNTAQRKMLSMGYQ